MRTKKWFALALALVLAFFTLAGCSAPATDNQTSGGDSAASAGTGEKEAARKVDLDLSRFSGNVVYSQVSDMMEHPEHYMDKVVRVKGTLNYFQDEKTKTEYFAVLVDDATACCAQGLEFVWAGEHKYPDDYPPLGSELTVVGRFATYEEYGNTYIQLLDAEVSWEG